MSFNFTFTGHAASKEAEAEIVKAAQKLWEMITRHHPADHHPSAWSNGSTEHHGAGPVENLSSDNPPAPAAESTDEPAEHADPAEHVGPSNSPDPGSPTDIPATPVAPSSYSQPSESLPQGDTGSSSSPSPSPSPSSTSSGTSESSDAYPSSQ